MNEEWYITNPKGHVWSIDEEGNDLTEEDKKRFKEHYKI